jgi:hypothetical protein
MDAMDMSIYEEWHAGIDNLIMMDQIQFKG